MLADIIELLRALPAILAVAAVPFATIMAARYNMQTNQQNSMLAFKKERLEAFREDTLLFIEALMKQQRDIAQFSVKSGKTMAATHRPNYQFSKEKTAGASPRKSISRRLASLRTRHDGCSPPGFEPKSDGIKVQGQRFSLPAPEPKPEGVAQPGSSPVHNKQAAKASKEALSGQGGTYCHIPDALQFDAHMCTEEAFDSLMDETTMAEIRLEAYLNGAHRAQFVAMKVQYHKARAACAAEFAKVRHTVSDSACGERCVNLTCAMADAAQALKVFLFSELEVREEALLQMSIKKRWQVWRAK